MVCAVTTFRSLKIDESFDRNSLHLNGDIVSRGLSDSDLREAAHLKRIGHDSPAQTTKLDESLTQLGKDLASSSETVKKGAEAKLLALLKDSDPERRDAAVKFLCSTLSNPNVKLGEGENLFLACTNFLAENAINSFLSEKQKDDLLSCLKSLAHDTSQNNFAAEAYSALAFMGDKQARQEMIEYLRKTPHGPIADKLTYALGNYHDREVTELLLNLLHEPILGGVVAVPVLLAQGVSRPEMRNSLDKLLIGALTPGAGESFSSCARRLLEDGLTGPDKERFRKDLLAAAQKLPRTQREQIEQGLVAFDKARELGIIPTLRVGFDVLPEIVKNRIENKPDGRPLAVIALSTKDGTGVLYSLDQTIRDLMKAGYRVVIHSVNTDHEFVNALQDATKIEQAQVVLIAGHGKPTSIAFGAGDPAKTDQSTIGPLYLDTHDQEYLAQSGVGNCLAPGGQILLVSCSAGKGGITGNNVAGMLHHIFPQAAPEGIFFAEEPIRLTSGLTMSGQVILNIGFINEEGAPATSRNTSVARPVERGSSVLIPQGKFLSN